jgi:hypothetical protein
MSTFEFLVPETRRGISALRTSPACRPKMFSLSLPLPHRWAATLLGCGSLSWPNHTTYSRLLGMRLRWLHLYVQGGFIPSIRLVVRQPPPRLSPTPTIHPNFFHVATHRLAVQSQSTQGRWQVWLSLCLVRFHSARLPPIIGAWIMPMQWSGTTHTLQHSHANRNHLVNCRTVTSAYV